MKVTNQRNTQTKYYLREALLNKLKEKDLDHISVREICQKAGINRTTFYNHYGIIRDVLDEMSEDYLSHLKEWLDEFYATDEISSTQMLSACLSYMEQNLELSRHLLRNKQDNEFSDKLLGLPKIKELLSEKMSPNLDEKFKEEAILFVTSGSFRLMQEWIFEDNRCKANEEAGKIIKLCQLMCY